MDNLQLRNGSVPWEFLLIASFVLVPYTQITNYGTQAAVFIGMLVIVAVVGGTTARPSFSAILLLSWFVVSALASSGWPGFGWAAMACATYIAGLNIGGSVEPRRLAYLYVIALALVAVVSISLFFGAPSMGRWAEGGGALRGFLSHRNQLGFMMVTGFAFLSFAEPWRRPSFGSGAHRALTGCLWVLFGITLILTQSVAGFALALLVVGARIMASALARGGTRKRWAMFGLSLPLAVIGPILLWSNAGALLGLFGRDLTLTGRTAIWGAGMELWRISPWFGQGFGILDDYERFTGIRSQRLVWVGYNVHSGFVNALIELGVVGLAVWIWFLVVNLHSIVRLGNTSAAHLLLVLWLLYVVRNTTETAVVGLGLLILGLVGGQVQQSARRRQSIGAGGLRGSNSMRSPTTATASSQSGSSVQGAGRPAAPSPGGTVGRRQPSRHLAIAAESSLNVFTAEWDR